MSKFEDNELWIEEMTKYIISSFWDTKKYKIKNKDTISSIFLAWAPWAGKTEFLDTIFNDLKEDFIIIDIDKYRCLFKWYNWENSSEFQNSCNRVADKLIKFCFQNNLNFIFDWTFKSYWKVEQNLKQCQKYNRNSLITLIFQDPRISFYYTFLRKLDKKRNVPIQVFIDWFYNSIFNFFKAKKDFKNLDLMIAHKKYTFLDKDKFYYNIDYNTNNLRDFCNKYKIVYNKGEFTNKQKVRLDLENFYNILTEHFNWKSSIWSKINIWLTEKVLKWFNNK